MVALAVITAIAIYFGPETYKADIGATDTDDVPAR